MERARQRMMANVPKADVVITNPTHFAVALEYKHGEMDITSQTETFNGFVKFMTRAVIAILAVLIFMAIFTT